MSQPVSRWWVCKTYLTVVVYPAMYIVPLSEVMISIWESPMRIAMKELQRDRAFWR